MLKEYFTHLLKKGMTTSRLTLAPQSFDYIVKLLMKHASDSTICGNSSMPILAFSYDKALSLPDASRPHAFRELGDVALFIAGFFVGYVEMTGGLTYYIDMGGNAYRCAGDMLNNSVMHELSSKFKPIVGALNDSMLSTDIGQRQTIERLYDIHSMHGSSSAANALLKAGYVPIVGVFD